MDGDGGRHGDGDGDGGRSGDGEANPACPASIPNLKLNTSNFVKGFCVHCP